MRPISKLIVHCSATPPDMDVGVAEIRRWHVEGNGWADIGYHWVIRRNGDLEAGRPEARQGAHCAAQGGNIASIGVCMVGGVRRQGGKLVVEDNFTPSQYDTLRKFVRDKVGTYPIDTILGHRDLDPGKACPSFSVKDWLVQQRVLEPVAPPEWQRPDFSNVVSGASTVPRQK